MRKLMLCFFALTLVFGVNAQEKEVVNFNETTYDFGTIKEEAGRVTHVFTCENTNATPISIKNVKASCGCTTPNLSKAPIAPGETRVITVTYNASGRPGMFQKSITVTLTNGQEEFTKVRYIMGNVTPRPKEEPQLQEIK